MAVSAVVPALNAAATLGATLAGVRWTDEVLLVDGGSLDGTWEMAASLGARVIAAPCGRGSQLAAGAAAARHEWLLLLHADTRLAPPAAAAASAHIREQPGRAGYFRFALDSVDPRARRLEALVAWRCRRLALPYGDQGLLLHRDLLAAVGGIRSFPLMEDVDLIRRLGRGRLAALDADAVTSAEKWQHGGWRRRSARNLLCLSLWFAGMPPHYIARLYQ